MIISMKKNIKTLIFMLMIGVLNIVTIVFQAYPPFSSVYKWLLGNGLEWVWWILRIIVITVPSTLYLRRQYRK